MTESAVTCVIASVTKAMKYAESGDGLGTVAQGMDDHPASHTQQQDRAGHGIVDHPGGVQRLHGVDREVEGRPAAAQQSLGEGLVALALFEDCAGRRASPG